MNKLLVFSGLIFLTFTLCNCQNNSSNPPKNSGSVSNGLTSSQKEVVNDISGIWKLKGDENPTFEIKRDSIYYIDQGEIYAFNTKSDSIFIFYNDWIYKGLFAIKEGKLILTDGTNKSIYLKWK